MNDRPTFDSAREISINLRSAEGARKITVRFPTDAEWVERQRRRKIIIKQLGRNTSETILPDSEEDDLELVNKLRTPSGENGGPAIDAFEASFILDQLSQADVDDVVADAGGYRITLRVPGGITAHVLETPSAKDVIQYRRAFARRLDLPYNKQQLTINLAAAGEFYKRLCLSKEGYAGEVPIIHQAVVLKAAIDALEDGMGVADSENF